MAKDITPKYNTIQFKDAVVLDNEGFGQRIGGIAGFGGTPANAINKAVSSEGNIISDVINERLDTSAKQILGDFTFGASGAIKMITDADNGLWLSPTGILGKKAGNTTFAIDTEGNATFGGTLSAAAGTLGTITTALITVGTTGYVRGGQTAYDTGTGFFLGYDSSAYKFSIGSSTKKMTFDGSDLAITGGTITGGTIQTATSGGRWRIKSQDSTITQYWLKDNTDLGRITIQDIDARYQGFRFDLYDTNLSSATAFYIQRSADGISLYSPAAGDLGTSDYRWDNGYIDDTLYFFSTSGSPGIEWRKKTGSLGARAGIKIYDITEEYNKIQFALGRYVSSPESLAYRYVYMGYSGVSGVEFYPSNNDTGMIGTSSNYWRWVYANYVRYKDLNSFQHHNDIDLIKDIGEKQIKKNGKNVKVWDMDTLPQEVKEDGFYDAGAVQGLTIGTLKQVIEKLEKLEKKVEKLNK